MQVTYDADCDGLRILFNDAPIERSSNEVPGLIVDFDNNGSVVGLELINASERMNNPRAVEFIESSPAKERTSDTTNAG